MKETQKIAGACFVGGAICYVVAALFAPQYAWLGVFAGLAGGYLAYEFREVLRAIPVAFRATGKGAQVALADAYGHLDQWLSKPHAISYASVIMSSVVIRWFLLSPSGDLEKCIGVNWWAPVLFIVIAGTPLFSMFFRASLMLIVCIGMNADEQEAFLGDLRLMDAAYLVGSGVLRILKFVVWRVWVYLITFTVKAIVFCATLLWALFKLIHSHKRVLCAIDGTIGGVISFLCFHSQNASVPEHVLLAAFGGLIGAAWGVLNWEIISIRLLKVNVASKSV